MEEKIFDCEGDETEFLKYGDVFTVGVDKTARNWQMVDNKKFRLVPRKEQQR